MDRWMDGQMDGGLDGWIKYLLFGMPILTKLSGY